MNFRDFEKDRGSLGDFFFYSLDKEMEKLHKTESAVPSGLKKKTEEAPERTKKTSSEPPSR